MNAIQADAYAALEDRLYAAGKLAAGRRPLHFTLASDAAVYASSRSEQVWSGRGEPSVGTFLSGHTRPVEPAASPLRLGGVAPGSLSRVCPDENVSGI